MAQIPIDFPANSITDGMIRAGVRASKFTRHQSIDAMLFGRSTSVAALTQDLHIVRGSSGTLLGFQATINGAIATGTDRTVTVDLQKSTGAGAFATVLSGTIQFDDESVLRTPGTAVFSSTGIVAGDILAVVVTVAGSDAAQATGLNITLTFEETYS